jgi:hypothetical protein
MIDSSLGGVLFHNDLRTSIPCDPAVKYKGTTMTPSVLLHYLEKSHTRKVKSARKIAPLRCMAHQVRARPDVEQGIFEILPAGKRWSPKKKV